MPEAQARRPRVAARRAAARRAAREGSPLLRWGVVLLFGLALGGGALAFVPGLREQAERIVEEVRGGAEVSGPRADLGPDQAWLWLESDVPVEVFLGPERLGSTPLSGKPVPSGRLALKLVNTSRGIERIVVLKAEAQGEVRHHEPFAIGRVQFRSNRECDVYIGDRKVARAPGPPLDYFAGSYSVECRNENEGLIDKKKISISADANRITEVSFKLDRM